MLENTVETPETGETTLHLPPKTSTQRVRAFRERKKARIAPTPDNPKTDASEPAQQAATDYSERSDFRTDSERKSEVPAAEEPAKDISRPPKRMPVRTKDRWQTLSPELRE